MLNGALDTAAASVDVITSGAILLSLHLFHLNSPCTIGTVVPIPTAPAEIFVVSNSIVRSVELIGIITYCLPSRRVADIIELSSLLSDNSFSSPLSSHLFM